jgi:hypothetical protein
MDQTDIGITVVMGRMFADLDSGAQVDFFNEVASHVEMYQGLTRFDQQLAEIVADKALTAGALSIIKTMGELANAR